MIRADVYHDLNGSPRLTRESLARFYWPPIGLALLVNRSSSAEAVLLPETDNITAFVTNVR